MCDYSLTELENRPAKVGDKLTLHRFPTGTRGFVEDFSENRESHRELPQGGVTATFSRYLKEFWGPGGSEDVGPCAVCVPFGARLAVCVSVALQRQLGIRDREEGVMMHLPAGPCVHRDAIRFKNGTVVSLQDLPIGQRAEVLVLEEAFDPDYDDGPLADVLVDQAYPIGEETTVEVEEAVEV